MTPNTDVSVDSSLPLNDADRAKSTCLILLAMNIFVLPCRDGKVTFEKELSYNYSCFQVRNSGTLVTSVTVTTIKS